MNTTATPPTPTATAGGRTCPVPQCGRPIGTRVIVCRDHWERVPSYLKPFIRAACRQFVDGLIGERELARYRVLAVHTVTTEGGAQ